MLLADNENDENDDFETVVKPVNKFKDCAGWPIRARRAANGKQIGSGPNVLSTEEVERFEQCRKLLRERRALEGWKETEPLLEDNNKMSDDDLLLRFFFARDGKVEECVKDTLNSIKWRKEKDIEHIHHWCAKNFPVNIVQTTHTKGLCGFHGFDSEGYPIWWDRPNQKGVVEAVETYGMDAVMNWHFATVERGREMAKSMMVDRITIVLDLQDVSGTGVVFGKPGAMLKAQTGIDQQVYPECMRKLFMINAPWGFASAWSGIRLLLDKRVQEKITILGKRSPNDAFAKYIPDDSIPVEFGGTVQVDWSVCRMRAVADSGIFKAPMYLERLRTLAEEQEKATRRLSKNSGHHGHKHHHHGHGHHHHHGHHKRNSMGPDAGSFSHGGHPGLNGSPAAENEDHAAPADVFLTCVSCASSNASDSESWDSETNSEISVTVPCSGSPSSPASPYVGALKPVCPEPEQARCCCVVM
ncbi:SEC14 cytosolic factor [Diplonema papillatum]|nr:SEC14 cytosolic factor [Diplonema papillatum]